MCVCVGGQGRTKYRCIPKSEGDKQGRVPKCSGKTFLNKGFGTPLFWGISPKFFAALREIQYLYTPIRPRGQILRFQKNPAKFLPSFPQDFAKYHHPAAKGVRQKEFGKKVTKKGDRSIRKSDRKVTESVPKTKKSDRTPFAALLLRHPDIKKISRRTSVGAQGEHFGREGAWKNPFRGWWFRKGKLHSTNW